MSMTIAFAGKGGSGKTTLMPSLIHTAYALRPDERRIVGDLDPHQSLSTLLGHTSFPTVGAIRSDYERQLLGGAAQRLDETREHFLEARMGEQALLSTPTYDFIALGQWELPGSQCTPNRVMERALAHLLARYDLALLDHEAGIEHIGRYAAIPLDGLVIVSTPERMALDVAQRVWGSVQQLNRRVGSAFLLLNRVRPGDLERSYVSQTVETLTAAGVQYLGAVEEAPDYPDMLPTDDTWWRGIRPIWTRLLLGLRAWATLHSARGALVSSA